MSIEKAVSAAIDKSIVPLGKFLHKVLGEPIEVAAETFLTDPLRALRYARSVELQRKVEERLSQRGITETKAVPPKIAVPIIEQASLEDNDDLHTLWSELLTRAMDPSAPEVTRRYVSILSDLTGFEARICEYLWKDKLFNDEGDYRSVVVHPLDARNHTDLEDSIPSSQYLEAARSLVTYGILASDFYEQPAKYLSHGLKSDGGLFGPDETPVDLQELYISEFG